MHHDSIYRRLRTGLFCLLLVPNLAWSAESFSGAVVDESGNPLADARILLIPEDPSLAALETTTNLKGRYIFGLIRSGEYRLVAFSEGRRITRIDANIGSSGDASRWSVQQDVERGAELPSFEVTDDCSVTYDLHFGETAADPGEFGTGVQVNPVPGIVKLIQQGKMAQAIGELRTQIEKNPESGTLNYLIAFAQRAEGDLDGALASVERSVAAEPVFEGAQLLRGRILVERNRFEEALVSYKAEAATAGSLQVQSDSYLELALLHQRMQNDVEAIGALETLVGIAPDHVAALKELSALYIKTGDKDKSRQAMERLAALGGADLNLLYNLGAELYNAGDFEGATDYFRQVIALNARHAEAYFYLGFSRLGLKDTEGATKNLEKFLELSPADAANVPKARELLEKLASS